MTDQELKRLSRAELLELLIAQSKEVQQLKERLEQAEAKLVSRDIILSEAGSIAEASLQLNGVFAAAQAASQQYLENIVRLSQRQETVCAQMEQDCRDKVALQIAETERNCAAMEAQAKRMHDEMIDSAKSASQAYWDEVSTRLDAFYKEHLGLKELLATLPR
jgi:hypothetical protein